LEWAMVSVGTLTFLDNNTHNPHHTCHIQHNSLHIYTQLNIPRSASTRIQTDMWTWLKCLGVEFKPYLHEEGPLRAGQLTASA